MLDDVAIQLTKKISTHILVIPVDLKTFLYDEDYMRLPKLSDKQLEALEAADDNNPETNKFVEFILMWGKGCISGDAVIEGVDGRGYTAEQLEKLYKNPNFKLKINSYNTTTKELEEDVIEEVWIKGEDELFEVVMESGKKIQTTLEHRFLTDTGWKKLKDISEGDLLLCQ